MGKFIVNKGREYSSVRVIVMNLIRIMLVVAGVLGYFQGRDLVLLMAVLGLAVTFVPLILKKVFKLEIPASFEIVVILFIYGVLVFAGIKGSFLGVWWWDIILNFFAAIALGFVGVTFLTVLQNEDIIDTSWAMIGVMTFFFAVALGTIWEIFEFSLDVFFGFGLQDGLLDTMKDVVVNSVGALFVSFVGVYLLKSGKRNFMSDFVSKVVLSNFNFFKSKKHLEYSSNIIEDLIEKGEGDGLEFKSTLRKNLHTGHIDRNISHAVLKTIVAYLNSEGGTLLVGVKDSGEVFGLDADDFISHDRLRLFLNDLIRKHLGNRFLPYVRFEIYPIDDKHILKVDVNKSDKRVFLKWEGREEFYVRQGPSSSKLSGNDMVDYIENRF